MEAIAQLQPQRKPVELTGNQYYKQNPNLESQLRRNRSFNSKLRNRKFLGFREIESLKILRSVTLSRFFIFLLPKNDNLTIMIIIPLSMTIKVVHGPVRSDFS